MVIIMKMYLFMTTKYMKAHTKRFISLIFCISLFITAFLTILWYNESYKHTVNEKYKVKNGAYELIGFDADQGILNTNMEQLQDEKAGIMNGFFEIKPDVWIGSADENALNLIPITVIQGRMPKNDKEIAVEISTYNLLELHKNVGETINLSFTDSDGKYSSADFILTGILNNYSQKIKNSSNESQKFFIPSLITVGEDIQPKFTHIFAKKLTYLTQNLGCEFTYFTISDKYEVQTKMNINNMIFIPIAIFFIITSIMGIFSVILYFFNDQEKNLRLLRCIGFTRKKAMKMLLLQAIILWLCALFLSICFSLVILLIIQYISSFSAEKLLLSLGMNPIFYTMLLSFVIIVISMLILIRTFYKESPIRKKLYVSSKTRKSQIKLRKCWHNAYKRKYRLQNCTCVMLIFLCVGMSIFGSFLPLFSARETTFSNPDNFPNEADYALHMLGGTSQEDSYYIQFPIGSGVKRNQIEKIIHDNKMEVLEMSVSHLCVPFFLTSKDNPENEMLKAYLVDAAEQGYDFVLKHSKSSEMIQLAGGNPDNDCLIDLPVKWISGNSVTKAINIQSKFNIDDFNNGISIIAPSNRCSVGDEFVMIIPIPDNSATQQNISEHISFKCQRVKVSEVYNPNEMNTNELIISLDYLFSIYPDLNYETVVLKNTNRSDINSTQILEQNLEQTANISDGVVFDNYSIMAKEFYDDVNAQTFQIIISILIFIVIILVAIVFSSYVQIQSNLQSYMTMRAIGGTIQTLQRLILNEVSYLLNVGIVCGTVVGYGICIFFAKITSIKTWDIFLIYVLPIYVSTIIFMYIGTYIATKKFGKSLISKNILENMNITE